MDHSNTAHTQGGAQRLKKKIEDYWYEKGYLVDVKLIDAHFAAAVRSCRTDLRSDMRNGFPTRRLEASRAVRH